MLNDLKIVLLAGKGERFISKGYTVPKGLLKFNDLEIAIHSANSIPKCAETIFGLQIKDYKNYDIQNTIENLSLIFEEKIKRVNYEVEKLPDKFKVEAQKLLPHKNYIGFSITQGNLYRKKSWPIKNFIILANKILKKNKIPVFFIEKTNIKLFEKLKTEVPNSIIPEFDTDISCPALVTALGERLEKAVSIDNGIMHMLSISKIPLIVLFGPTSSEKFAPLNENTTILDTKKLYKSKNIETITIDEVFNLI